MSRRRLRFVLSVILGPIAALAQPRPGPNMPKTAKTAPTSNPTPSISAQNATQFDQTVKVDSYQFDPNTVLRDPFEAPFLQKHGDKEEDEILRFDIKEIKLVAVMKGVGSAKAMLKLPNNHYHLVQVGD